ncbi:MAG TPA: hypothetical protein PK983_11375 [Syntrophales bacterium]|nr:hypothetical protein [Syntrophales bacterium]
MCELTIDEYKRSKATMGDKLRWKLRHAVPLWAAIPLILLFLFCVAKSILMVGR